MDLSQYINIDSSKMNIMGVDIRRIKRIDSKNIAENTLIYTFISKEYSMDVIIPNVGDLFLGVVRKKAAGITEDTIQFSIGGVSVLCKNVYGYLRPSDLPIEHRKPIGKIRIGATFPTDQLELAYLKT
jgi:hypothetical protein